MTRGVRAATPVPPRPAAVTNNRIEIRYPRSASLLGAIVFLGVLWMWADFGFFHSLPYAVPAEKRGGVVYWLVLLPIVLSVAMTLKTVIAPSVIFTADQRGVGLGRGVFVNRVQHVPWSQVRQIEVDKFGVNADRGRPDRGIKLTFAAEVELSRVGLPTSRRSGEHQWEIRNSVFPESVERVAERLQAMKAVAGG